MLDSAHKVAWGPIPGMQHQAERLWGLRAPIPVHGARQRWHRPEPKPCTGGWERVPWVPAAPIQASRTGQRQHRFSGLHSQHAEAAQSRSRNVGLILKHRVKSRPWTSPHHLFGLRGQKVEHYTALNHRNAGHPRRNLQVIKSAPQLS